MKEKTREEKNMEQNKSKGITLVALVVTIVILIILATISMMALFGENGLITKSEKGKELHEQGKEEEQNNLDMYTEYSGNYLNGVSAGTRPTDPPAPEEPEIPKGPNGKQLVNKDTVTTTNHEKIEGEDTLGNGIVVPKGFKIAEESGTTVKQGIIIEDEIGNQFVWVPVSNIDGSGSNKIKINSSEEEGVEITLGRYTFDSKYNSATGTVEGTGEAIIIQKGSEYDKTVSETNKDEKYKINGASSSHYEFSQARLTNYKNDLSALNTTAKDLKGFVESVRDNHGYYIARYEASFGSGVATPEASKINTAEYITNQKLLSQPSTKHTRGSRTEKLEEGMLWNWINQGDAAKVCRNMYIGDSYGVESDLVNSYMWDTAIVYIQKMGNANYASATSGSNTSLKDTGTTNDEKCHIFDMAGNLIEWTTEYCAETYTNNAYPCTGRGVCYNSASGYIAPRSSFTATFSRTEYLFPFRTLCKVNLTSKNKY